MRGHSAGCVFHLPAVWGVHKQFSLLFHTCACKPSSCATLFSLFFFCFVSHSPWQFNTQYISVTYSISLSLTSIFLPATVFSQFTSSKQPPFSFPSIFFAVSSPLVLCLCPLIRFGLGAISFGHVCGGVLPWLAQYPGKALRLCRY